MSGRRLRGVLALALLLGGPVHARSVTSLTYDELPRHIEYQGARGRLVLDGVVITGRRSDKRAYLEAILPICPAAAKVERRRLARWRAGNALFFVGMGGVVVYSLTAAPEELEIGAAAGLAVLGGVVAATGASLQPSIRAYNTCAEAPPEE